MFNHLIVSDPKRLGLKRSFSSSFFSVVTHGALLGVGVLATTSPPPVSVEKAPPVQIIFPTNRRQIDRAADPQPNSVAPLENAPGATTLNVPTKLPVGIPDIDMDYVVDPRNFSGRVTPGVLPGAADGGQIDRYGTYSQNLVDEVPETLNCPAPRYPNLLAQARINGSVTLEFIVTAEGVADPQSIRALHSDHREFERSARDAVLGCRFRPGRFRGRAVNVLVEQPFSFAFQR